MATTMKRVNWAGGALVVLAYLLQLPTPLRVNTDGVIYLSLASSFNDGHGFVWHHHKAHFPSGYPAIVAALERIGLASSSGLIAWNYLMIAIAICSGIWLLERWLKLSRTIAVSLSLLYLLSWATIRYALIPGSEMTYIAFSFLCLQCLTVAETAEGNVAWMWWTLAVILVPLAMSVRLVGVVLPPAVVWTLIVIFWRRRRAPQISLADWIKKYRAMLAILGVFAVIIAAVVAWAITRTSYFREDLSLMIQRGIANELIFTIKQRLLESASMLSNIPSKNVLLWLDRPLTCAGLPCLLLILFLLLRRFRSLASIDVYLIGYVALLMVWPYAADVRFWLPVQLLLFGLIVRELMELARRLPAMATPITIAAQVWVVIFLLLGCASLVWNTQLAYSGDRFSERWDVYYFRDTYRLASRNGLPVNPKSVNDDLLPVLKRFGGRDFNR